jgi:GTP:adenosylcobinamide-phosphate guanylyltransferase
MTWLTGRRWETPSQRLSVFLLSVTVGAFAARALAPLAASIGLSTATRYPIEGSDCRVLEKRGTRMQRHDPATDRPQVRTALLLAAGLGMRLAPLTVALPKCLVSVSGTPILERLVRSLDSHGIERLVIVAGYRAEMIRDYLGESFGGIALEYVVSPVFATTNSLYSLWLARDLVDEPFVLVESDIVFDAPLLMPLLQPDRIAVSAQLPWMSGTTVTLDAQRRVNAFYSPPPGVYGRHCRAADHFITVNLTSLARDTWAEARERLDRHVAAGHTGYFHDVVFAEMTAAGSMSLEAVIFPTDRWYEVDTPVDRDAAELVFPRRLQAAGGSGRHALSGRRRP